MTDRLFFALWPDARLHGTLTRCLPPLLDGVRGKAQRPDQWHVTLEFLGAVAHERHAAVCNAADQVEAGPFTVEFDGVEHWRRPQVYCLVASRVPAELARLVGDLRAALRDAAFVPEARDYRAHVTLARKVRDVPVAPLARPIEWAADRFALVRSVTDPAGSRYEPLRWWNLRHRGG